LADVIEALSHLSGHRLRVEINPALVRTNELHRLCGDPSKLYALMESNGLKLPLPTLQDTLRTMLLAGGAKLQ
jgi:hypothetical protein